MNKARRMLVVGLGAMTPAFVGMDQAQARVAGDSAIAPAQSGSQTMALDQDALKSALLGLSPAEKLRIAGDRIRLAKSMTKPKVQSTQKGRVAVSNQCVTITQTVCPWRSRAR